MKRTVASSSSGLRSASEGICEVDCIDGGSVSSALASLPSDASLDVTAAALRVIGNPARLRLVLALAEHELCVCDCANLLRQSTSAASQHLKELRRIGAVRFRQAGKLAFYSLADPHLIPLICAFMTLKAEGSRT